ncbi:hypothetical protein Ancab_025912 [Ancistrocladus abbreviatus]
MIVYKRKRAQTCRTSLPNWSLSSHVDISAAEKCGPGNGLAQLKKNWAGLKNGLITNAGPRLGFSVGSSP